MRLISLFVAIILLANSASLSNLFSEDGGDLDFLDQLLKEIESMEKSDEGKIAKFEDSGTTPIKSAPIPKFGESFKSKDEFLAPTEKEVVSPKKDTRTLFLDPDVKEFKSKGGKSTKTRPSADSVNALKHYSSIFSTTSFSVQNKILNKPELSPKFKESEFISFKNELETTNSMMDIIEDKGIYTANFLKPVKSPIPGKNEYSSDTAPTQKNIRQRFLDIISKLQNLDAELGELTEEKEYGVEILQKMASPQQRELPRYRPLAKRKRDQKATPLSPENKPSLTDGDFGDEGSKSGEK